MSYFEATEKAAWNTLADPKLHRAIRAYDDNIMMVEMSFDKGAVGAPHAHPHTQVTYCLAGEFEFTVGEETTLLKAEGSVYMPPNVEHSCKLLSGSGKLLDIFTPCRKDFLPEANK